jgi:carbamoyltransferase
MEKKETSTISIYGSHDSSVTFIDKSGKLRIYEYERFVKKRFAMFSSSFDFRKGMGSNQEERESFLSLIKKNLFNKDINLILYAELNDNDINFIKIYFPNAEFKKIGHHFSHACSAYFSSGFDNALIFSVDGGGMDSGSVFTTKAYIGKGNNIQDIFCKNYDFGNPYSAIGFPISEIKPGAEGSSNKNSLVYAGKIMGLCAYGKVIDEWKGSFYDYYNDNNLDRLCQRISVSSGFNSVSAETSYNLAATSQYTFETMMNELILPFVDKYKTNVVLVGGCALNVLYNQRLYETLKEKNLNLFVPPNPNDCGQSYGMFLSEFPELGKEEIVYNGLEILDIENFDNYVSKYKNEDFNFEKLIKHLKNGKIIGIIKDESEVGPRALGNRSIICDPSFPQMKNILNSKVKFREWYRPFAPVCRLEDSEKYFLNSRESSFMSYAPKVRQEYKEQLASIVHVDNTTRLQTTTKEQHSFFYDILSELDKNNFIPVILNTSFNINGLPILTTLQDAFYVLDNTELDFLIVKDKIFEKGSK